MKLPDVTQFDPLNIAKQQIGTPIDHSQTFPSSNSKPRAVVLLQSGRRLDLLNPDPNCWTNEDLAIGLSRTYRWAGHSAWELPLSVAQHSLTVLALREAIGPLSPAEALRELLHDATEALMGGFDCIAPLKPHLGSGFSRLDERLQAAVNQRYRLPPWTEQTYSLHKHADRLAAACEAVHVVGWSRTDIRGTLEIQLIPLDEDPLTPPPGLRPWQPWPPTIAQEIFFKKLTELQRSHDTTQTLAQLAEAFERLPPKMRLCLTSPPTGDRHKDTLVFVDALDNSLSIEGVIVDGLKDEDGKFCLGEEFTIFTIDNDPRGELLGINGWNCHVEIR